MKLKNKWTFTGPPWLWPAAQTVDSDFDKDDRDVELLSGHILKGSDIGSLVMPTPGSSNIGETGAYHQFATMLTPPRRRQPVSSDRHYVPEWRRREWRAMARNEPRWMDHVRYAKLAKQARARGDDDLPLQGDLYDLLRHPDEAYRELLWTLAEKRLQNER